MKIRTSGKYKIVMLEISTDYCINYEVNKVPRKVKLINQKKLKFFRKKGKYREKLQLTPAITESNPNLH